MNSYPKQIKPSPLNFFFPKLPVREKKCTNPPLPCTNLQWYGAPILRLTCRLRQTPSLRSLHHHDHKATCAAPLRKMRPEALLSTMIRSHTPRHHRAPSKRASRCYSTRRIQIRALFLESMNENKVKLNPSFKTPYAFTVALPNSKSHQAKSI
jgi:hypothetical protein